MTRCRRIFFAASTQPSSSTKPGHGQRALEFVHTCVPSYSLHPICPSIHACIRACVHAPAYTLHMFPPTYIHNYPGIHAYTTHAYILKYIHTCIHAYMHAHIVLHTGTDTCIAADRPIHYTSVHLHTTYMHPCMHAFMNACIHTKGSVHKAAAYGGPGQRQRRGSGEPSRQATGLRRTQPVGVVCVVAHEEEMGILRTVFGKLPLERQRWQWGSCVMMAIVLISSMLLSSNLSQTATVVWSSSHLQCVWCANTA